MMWIFAIDFGVYNTSIEITVRRKKGEHHMIAHFGLGCIFLDNIFMNGWMGSDDR